MAIDAERLRSLINEGNIDDHSKYLSPDNRSSAEVNDHGSKTLSIIALILASAALGGFVTMLFFMDYRVQAGVDRVRLETQGAIAAMEMRTQAAITVARIETQTDVSEARIAMQASNAKAEAISAEAKTHARVALDKVEDFRVKLSAAGTDVGPLDGH